MRAIPLVVPYLWAGGIVMKVQVAGKHKNVSLLVAIGPAPEGYRGVLGIAPGFLQGQRLLALFSAPAQGKGPSNTWASPYLMPTRGSGRQSWSVFLRRKGSAASCTSIATSSPSARGGCVRISRPP
jgi:hypothetical protein